MEHAGRKRRRDRKGIDFRCRDNDSDNGNANGWFIIQTILLRKMVLWAVALSIIWSSMESTTTMVGHNNNDTGNRSSILRVRALPRALAFAPLHSLERNRRGRGICIRIGVHGPRLVATSHHTVEHTRATFTTTTNANTTTTTTTTTTNKTTPIPPIPPPISDTTPCAVLERFPDSGEEFYFPSPEDYDAVFPRGDQGGYHIVRQYRVGDAETTYESESGMPLQEALVALDPDRYPTLTRARKACRRGMVLVRRGGLGGGNPDNEALVSGSNGSNNSTELLFWRGRVGDLVYPSDIIGCQLFLGTYRRRACYPCVDYPRPQFEMPVVYEDDHLAVVNKPAGIAVYSDTREGNRRTVHFALPFVLAPPARGTPGGLLRRPGIAHRLDKATAGLLVVAKTRIAMESLKGQFENRTVHKLYTAIVNGDPRGGEEEDEEEAAADHDNNNSDNNSDQNHEPSREWSVIDWPLGGKRAVTAWKILRTVPSLNAQDRTLTKIRVRLHTGRYHQIRRHFAWWHGTPLVGDPLYHSGGRGAQAHHFRKKGLCLCSDGISFVHPAGGDSDGNSNSNSDGQRVVEVTLDLPGRFDKLMNAEEAWANNQHSRTRT